MMMVNAISNKLSSAGDQPCMIKFFKVRLERFFVTSEEEHVKLSCEQFKLSLGHINLSWTEGM